MSVPGNGSNRALLTAQVPTAESTIGYAVKDRITVAESTVITLPVTLIRNAGAVPLFLDWATVALTADEYASGTVYSLSFSAASQVIAAGSNFDQTDLAEDAPVEGWAWDSATRHLTVPAGTWVVYVESDVKPDPA